MKYRINPYNKDYFMLSKHTMAMEAATLLAKDETNLTPDKREIKDILINVLDKLKSYKAEKGIEPIIIEIAISKKSKLGTYLLNCSKEYKSDMITENQITHALFISIEDEELEYYTVLSDIIMNYKQNNIKAIGYNEFQEQYGQELTDFILTSMSRMPNIYDYNNNKNVYLYENNKITKTDLPDQAIIEYKTKKRTIN